MPINGDLFQKKLLTHSAPTLANMKTGSLFRILKREIDNIKECLEFFSELFCEVNLDLRILSEDEVSVLIYVYNQQKLEHILSCPRILQFLSQYGYEESNVQTNLQHLQTRLQESEFPHEIGVFLGYPLQDVIQFIHPCKQCLCTGYWKVYGNQKKCQKKFYRFDSIKKIMELKLSSGEDFMDIVRQLN